jgi:hypothetical protein
MIRITLATILFKDVSSLTNKEISSTLSFFPPAIAILHASPGVFLDFLGGLYEILLCKRQTSRRLVYSHGFRCELPYLPYLPYIVKHYTWPTNRLSNEWNSNGTFTCCLHREERRYSCLSDCRLAMLWPKPCTKPRTDNPTWYSSNEELLLLRYSIERKI